MKFPYKLSKERLSLLTKEDREIYEYEHSMIPFLSENKLKEPDEDDEVFEDPTKEDIKKLATDVDEFDDDEKQQLLDEFDDILFEEISSLITKDLKECYGEENYEEYKKDIITFTNDVLKEDKNSQPINEFVGKDVTFWLPESLPNVGWIGKLAAGALAGLLGIILWLLMKGYDKLAMEKLKRYMNKLVELTDQGVNKKRPWYSFLLPTKGMRNNTGEYNKACFRTIQETEERNMACLYATTLHQLGFMPIGAKSFKGVTENSYPAKGSGLDTFINKINKVIKIG